ncbi:MAG TPA: hypothetical protein VJ949_03525 [Cryomorphaceae bacterium]|nr:hypothetical protein [Cryomorphaceae bacterium]
MKTINQVLLALIFVAFSTVGFAQSSTTWPQSTVKLNDDIRFEDYDINDDDDDEESTHSNVDTDLEIEELKRVFGQNANGNPTDNSNYVIWIPNRD